MNYVGPFTYNGARFALGTLSLLPLLMRSPRRSPTQGAGSRGLTLGREVLGGMLAGLVLFGGASLQQVGLIYTTAGKAGFITGLYVILVPILGLFFGQRTGSWSWLGALLAGTGLYLLSITADFKMLRGDVFVFLGAFFWAFHVLILAWLSPKIAPTRLAFWQFAVCSILSLITAFLLEVPTLPSVLEASVPILYGGVLSVGVAYTLQVVAQRDAKPAHAAILLSLESVFAALGGWLILEEGLSTRGIAGCALMLTGMLVSQLRGIPPRH